MRRKHLLLLSAAVIKCSIRHWDKIQKDLLDHLEANIDWKPISLIKTQVVHGSPKIVEDTEGQTAKRPPLTARHIFPEFPWGLKSPQTIHQSNVKQEDAIFPPLNPTKENILYANQNGLSPFSIKNSDIHLWGMSASKMSHSN